VKSENFALKGFSDVFHESCSNDLREGRGIMPRPSFWRFWNLGSHPSEGRRWLEAVLALDGAERHAVGAEPALPARRRAFLRLVMGILSAAQGDDDRAVELYEESLTFYERLGHRKGTSGPLRELGAAAYRRGDYDLAGGSPIEVYFGPNLAGPLYAGIPDGARAKRVLETLENDGFGLSDEKVTPIPSYDLRGYGFSAEGYWRGPVWINIDWFLMRGLEDYGYEDHAARMRRTIVELCRDEGFYEYFDPASGQGLGSVLFSWSAALLLDVLLDNGG
jgi:hypothetical protein